MTLTEENEDVRTRKYEEPRDVVDEMMIGGVAGSVIVDTAALARRCRTPAHTPRVDAIRELVTDFGPMGNKLPCEGLTADWLKLDGVQGIRQFHQLISWAMAIGYDPDEIEDWTENYERAANVLEDLSSEIVPRAIALSVCTEDDTAAFQQYT